MGKFLTTSGNSYHIEKIIINAKRSITLVTPFLKLNNNIVERLSDADKKNIKITLIYGKNELEKEQQEILFLLKNISVYFSKNLHAKCYHNEDSMIITSMNLYEFSEKNNREMGVLIDKNIDNEIFFDALKEIESIKNNSVEKTKKGDKVILRNIELDIIDYHEFSKVRNLKLIDELNKRYKEIKINDNGTLKIIDFPFANVSIEISGRIDVIVNDYKTFIKIKRETRRLFMQLPDRYYWNRNQINIYTARNFKYELNNDGLQKIVNRYLEIINSIVEILS